MTVDWRGTFYGKRHLLVNGEEVLKSLTISYKRIARLRGTVGESFGPTSPNDGNFMGTGTVEDALYGCLDAGY